MVIGRPTKPWDSIAPARSEAITFTPGRLPNRCFVEISHVDAALTKMAFSSSPRAARALRLRLSSPASHQRKACVSSRRRTRLFSLGQIGVRHRLKEIRPDAHSAFHRAKPTRGHGRTNWRQPRHRRLAAGDDNLLARLDPGQEF